MKSLIHWRGIADQSIVKSGKLQYFFGSVHFIIRSHSLVSFKADTLSLRKAKLSPSPLDTHLFCHMPCSEQVLYCGVNRFNVVTQAPPGRCMLMRYSSLDSQGRPGVTEGSGAWMDFSVQCQKPCRQQDGFPSRVPNSVQATWWISV